MTTAIGTTEHDLILVQRPAVGGSRHGRVRPLCSCGWQGDNHTAEVDARIEGNEHIAMQYAPNCQPISIDDALKAMGL